MISGHVRLTLILFTYFKYKCICFWLKRFSNENKIPNSDTSKTSKYYFDVWRKLFPEIKNVRLELLENVFSSNTLLPPLWHFFTNCLIVGV